MSLQKERGPHGRAESYFEEAIRRIEAVIHVYTGLSDDPYSVLNNDSLAIEGKKIKETVEDYKSRVLVAIKAKSKNIKAPKK